MMAGVKENLGNTTHADLRQRFRRQLNVESTARVLIAHSVLRLLEEHGLDQARQILAEDVLRLRGRLALR